MASIIQDFEHVTVYDCGDWLCIEVKPLKHLPVKKKDYFSATKLKECTRCGAIRSEEVEECACKSKEFKPYIDEDRYGFKDEVELDPAIYYEAVDFVDSKGRGKRSFVRAFYRRDVYTLAVVLEDAKRLNKVWSRR